MFACMTSIFRQEQFHTCRQGRCGNLSFILYLSRKYLATVHSTVWPFSSCRGNLKQSNIEHNSKYFVCSPQLLKLLLIINTSVIRKEITWQKMLQSKEAEHSKPTPKRDKIKLTTAFVQVSWWRYTHGTSSALPHSEWFQSEMTSVFQYKHQAF